MMQNKLQVIRSDKGSALTTFGALFLTFVFILVWIAVANFVIDRTSFVRQELFQPEWLMIFSFLFGIAFHEFCQYALMRLFGGSPRYSGRKYDPNRTRIQRKYLSTVIMRFWSPGKKFTLAQYLIIVLSPTLITFVFFPVAMMLWRNHVFHSVIWIIGFINTSLIALDVVIALKLIVSGNLGDYVVDELEGTYLVNSYLDKHSMPDR